MKRNFLLAYALPLLSLVALTSSALHTLDAESFSLSLLRAKTAYDLGGLPRMETLSLGKIGQPWNVALIGTHFLTDFIFFRFGEQGLFFLLFALLGCSSILLFRLLERVLHSPGLSFLIALFSSFAIWSGVSDIGTALGILLFQLECLLLLKGGFFRTMVLVLLHPLFDSSFFLAPFLFFTARPLLRTPRFKDAALLTSLSIALLSHYGVEFRAHDDGNSLLIGEFLALVAIILSLGDRTRRRTVPLVFLTTIMGLVLQETLPLPVLGLLCPLLIATLLRRHGNRFALRITDGVRQLEARVAGFLSGKNKVGVFWLAGAFLYFQLASSLARPSNSEALIAPSVLEQILADRTLPMHRFHVGGFLGLRLDPILPPGAPRNIFDTGPVRWAELPAFLRARELFENPNAIQRIRSREVLCQGRDPSCRAFAESPSWALKAETSLPPQTERQLNQLPPARQEQFRKKIALSAFSLFSRKN